MTKRCSTVKTQRQVAKTVSAFAAYAEQTRAPFFGESALFSLIGRLADCRRRGPSVSKNARWALKAFGEVLTLPLTLSRPGVIDATKTPRGIASPKPTKTSPMLELEFAQALERLAASATDPMGKRVYAGSFLLM